MPVSVVTGATGGIGRWIALGLARAGHTVVMLARDRARGEAAQAWIAADNPPGRTDLLIADLASLAATAETGRRIAGLYPAIDVLVNNAGVFRSRREETPEGHEQVLAVNHLSPFVLTRVLLPALQNAAQAGGARIVNIGSSTADGARIVPDDLEGHRRWGLLRSYGQSKLALTMATLEWAQRLQGTGIVANVVHPGAVATGLVRSGGAIGLAWRAMAPFLLTEEQGADTPLHVALSPRFGGISGVYVKRRRIVLPSRLARNEALRAQVWQATEKLAGAA